MPALPTSPGAPAPAAPPTAPRRRHGQVVAFAGVLTVIGTVVAMAAWFAAPSSPDGEAVAVPAAADELQPAPRPVADPVRIHVASRAIEADMIALGLHGDGSLEVPASAHTAGWWSGGANPGEPGASVIVGHVDSRDGPGAFFGLADITAGERLTVERADGSSVHFRVERVEAHPKDAFPTEAVYGHTDAPTLRLVTCTGAFDRAARSYEDNLIVFAGLEADEAGLVAPAPVEEAGGETAGAETLEAAGAPAATTPAPDGRGVPIGLATLSVVGTAAAVTRQALRMR